MGGAITGKGEGMEEEKEGWQWHPPQVKVPSNFSAVMIAPI